MVELGQLEKHHADFEKRNVRVIVSSVEGPEDAKKTQASYPHLKIIADENHSLSDAVAVMSPHSAPDGGPTSAPTTLIVDGTGNVRWVHRPEHVAVRLSPDQVLAELDKNK